MFEKIKEDKFIQMYSEFVVSVNKKVYVVGGAVRDILLGLKRVTSEDIDLATTISLEENIKFATENNILVKIKNRKLEVVEFSFNGTSYEVARLRVEFYDSVNKHNPSNVRFVNSIEEDVIRRDFSINALYYDTHSNSLLDPINKGLEDIKVKRIQTVLDPNETFNVDPARILRLIELAGRTGFSIDEKTLECAKLNANKINDLTKQRIGVENNRIYSKKYVNEDYNTYIKRVNKLIKELGISGL